jgi:hypothetical protein
MLDPRIINNRRYSPTDRRSLSKGEEDYDDYY